MSNSREMNLEQILQQKFRETVWRIVQDEQTPAGNQLWWYRLARSMSEYLVKKGLSKDPIQIKKVVNLVISAMAREMIKDSKVDVSGQVHDVLESIANDSSSQAIENYVELTSELLLRSDIVNTIREKPIEIKVDGGCCGRPKGHPGRLKVKIDRETDPTNDRPF